MLSSLLTITALLKGDRLKLTVTMKAPLKIDITSGVWFDEILN